MMRVFGAIRHAWGWSTDFLCSHDGKPSNPKLMGWAILLAFVVGRPIPAVVVAILVASSFGIKTFQMWLQKASFAVNAADSVALSYNKSVSEQVVRHEWADGHEDGVL